MKTLNHAVFDLKYHLVFVVKYRKRIIAAPMLERLEEIARGVLKLWRCQLLEIGAEGDHVHLLIEGHPALNLARLAGNLKTVTSRKLRQEFAGELEQHFWKPYFWSKSYAAMSVSGHANLATLIAYIQAQEALEATKDREP